MAGDVMPGSPAIGTSLDSLIAPGGDTLRPSEPPPPPGDPPFGLTFSGGGFRATLAVLGVVRCLADAGLLGHVRYVSSVSGGSVANAVLARAWPRIRGAGYSTDAVDSLLIDPIVDAVSGRSLRSELVRNVWRVVGRKNRTDLLADALDRWWLGGIELEQLDPEVRRILYARARRDGATPPSSARRGVVFALASSFPPGHDAFDAFAQRHPEHRTWDGEDLAFVPTVFDRLDRRLCRALVYRGWWLTGAALTRHHHDELPLPDLGASPLLA